MPSGEHMLAAILRRLADALERGDDHVLREINSFLADIAPSKDERGARQEKAKKPRSSQDDVELDADMLNEKFAAYETREQLDIYIREKFENKTNIIKLAKKLQVHVLKQDDYATIVDKIVDSTVGYRLRQKAIRGE